MNEQPAKEWDEMDTKRQDEIVWQASVLAQIRDSKADVLGHIVRERLERAGRSGLAEALAPHGI